MTPITKHCFIFYPIIFLLTVFLADRAEAKEARILALGDSYTIGQGVDASDRWPVQLKELLQEKGLAVGAVDIIAQTGWTTRDLLQTLKAEDIEGPYDLVALLIGVNDQFQKRPVNLFIQDFNALLKEAASYAGNDSSRVIVISIPDWGMSPYGKGHDQKNIAEEIDNFNRQAKVATENMGFQWVDITENSRQPMDNIMFSVDGLHPSPKLYKVWAQIIFPTAYKILEK